jgi:predicted MFS family arabinose efflux permease
MPGTATSQESPSRWRLLLGGTLALAMAAGTFAPFAVGALGPFLVEDLGLARAQLGAITTVLFGVAAALSVAIGRLVDRVGGRLTLAGMFALAGLTLLAMAASESYAGLLAAAALGGVAVAATNPVTNQLVGTHIPRGTQGSIMGFKQSGVQMGAFLAGAVLPALALPLGWRGALAVAATVPLAAVVLAWWAVPRPAPQDGARAGDGARGDAGIPAPAPRYRRFVLWLAGYALLMGAGVATVATYLPLYAVEVLGLSPTRAGLVAALIGLVGIGGRILWARASERRGAVGVPLLLIALLSVVAVAGFWASAVAGTWLVWAGAVVFGATAVSWNAVGMLAVVREVDHASTGTASGIVLVGFYLGYVVAPVTFGWSVDHLGGYDAGWAGLAALFAVGAVVAARPAGVVGSGDHRAMRGRAP